VVYFFYFVFTIRADMKRIKLRFSSPISALLSIYNVSVYWEKSFFSTSLSTYLKLIISFWKSPSLSSSWDWLSSISSASWFFLRGFSISARSSANSYSLVSRSMATIRNFLASIPAPNPAQTSSRIFIIKIIYPNWNFKKVLKLNTKL
jgi:hypothetical protein